MAEGAKAAAEANDASGYICSEDEKFGDEPMDCDEIPVIDLGAEHELVVRNVAEACRKWGFFQVINHGISESLIQAALKVAREFFHLPAEQKQACTVNTSSNDPSGGVVAYGIEFTLKGTEITKPNDFRDFIRFFCDEAELLDAWPKEPPTLKTIAREYNKQTSMLEKRLLRIISEGLGLASECLSQSFGAKHRNMMMMNYYPAYHNPDVVKGISSHSDVSGITILLQDSVGGLEVRNEGRWYRVKPIQNAFVVNLADQLEILANGIYKSPEHRVRVDRNEERLSIASFYGPSLDTKISPLAQLVADGVPKFKESMTIDFLTLFYSRSLLGKKMLESVKRTE